MAFRPTTGVEAAKNTVPHAQPDVPDPGDPGNPPPSSGTVLTVGNTLGLASSKLGWTPQHDTTRTATTAQYMADTAEIFNQHLIGFGSATNPQPGAGAAYDWTFMDKTYGHPAKSNGYFAPAAEQCLTVCGCPPHMRSPKSGTTWDPMGPKTGTALTSLSEYTPCHSSWVPEFAQLIAAFAARYPWVKYFHIWNEMKGYFFGTQYTGSKLIPTGSNLPASGFPGSQRWWIEGYTYLFNAIWDAVKAVRPDAFIVGPYCVLNGFAWQESSQYANDAFPFDFDSPLYHTDKRSLQCVEYMLRAAHGMDAVCVDIRNLLHHDHVTEYYSSTTSPAPPTPDPTNTWTTNPDGGHHQNFYPDPAGIEGAVWNLGQRQQDFTDWVRSLGNASSTSAYRRPQADARVLPIWYAEWYAYGNRPWKVEADPHTGQPYTNTGTLNSHQEMASAFAWQYTWAMKAKTMAAMAWAPEGKVQSGHNDPAESNPLGLWYANSSATPLKLTELYPVMKSLKANFKAGVDTLFDVTTNNVKVWGLATAKKLMVVSRSKDPITLTLSDPGHSIHNTTITLTGFEVRFMDRNQSGNPTPSPNPSGFAMPTTDPAGMTRVFEDDFNTYGTIPIGSFPSATGGKWGGYAAGTADTSGNGEYNMGKTCSVSGGVLDINVHSEMVGGSQVNYGAAPWPIIPGNQPQGTIGGLSYNNISVRANIYYGQIEYAFRASAAPRWKTAWLLWPDVGGNLFPKYGEIDFVEGNLDGSDTIHGFMHRDEATVGSDQDSRDSGVVYANNVWHKAKIIWKPNFLEFWLDDVKIGSTITSRVPDHPMHWVFQTETQLNGGAPVPALGTSGHLQIDWIVVHQLDGIYP
jgi:hypothetical protein